jgi:hypothetical protein
LVGANTEDDLLPLISPQQQCANNAPANTTLLTTKRSQLLGRKPPSLLALAPELLSLSQATEGALHTDYPHAVPGQLREDVGVGHQGPNVEVLASGHFVNVWKPLKFQKYITRFGIKI